MKYTCVFLIFISLSVFDLVKSDLYFGLNNKTCHDINETLNVIDFIYNKTSENNGTTEDFRDYIAYNPQQCKSRKTKNYRCCLVKIKSDGFGYNFCGLVSDNDYSDISKIIENIKNDQERNFTQTLNYIKIDCESNYNKIFSFAILLMIVLIL